MNKEIERGRGKRVMSEGLEKIIYVYGDKKFTDKNDYIIFRNEEYNSTVNKFFKKTGYAVIASIGAGVPANLSSNNTLILLYVIFQVSLLTSIIYGTISLENKGINLKKDVEAINKWDLG